MKFSLGKAFIPLALGLGIMASSATQAGVIQAGNTQYEDQDWESQVTDASQDGLLNDGDILFALLEITGYSPVNGTINTATDLSASIGTQTSTGATVNTITAVSLIKVNGDPTVTGPLASYTFTAPTPAEWLALTGLTVDAAGGTMAVLYDDPANDPHVDPNAAGGITGSLATAIDGTKIAEFGLAGDAGEFWSASSITTTGGDPTDVTNINVLSFYAALNLIGTDPGLKKHNILGDPDLNSTNSALFTAATHLQIQGADGTGGGGNFQLSTDTDLYLSGVPAPATLALFGLGLAALGWSTRKKA